MSDIIILALIALLLITGLVLYALGLWQTIQAERRGDVAEWLERIAKK